MRRPGLLVLSLVLLAACRTPAPLLEPLPPDDERPGALLAALVDHAGERRALRGLASLAVDGEADLHLRGRQVLVLERPGRLRVEVLGLLQQTAAVLVTDAGHYEFFVARDRSYASGELYPGLLWQVARIDLAPEEVVALVLGAPPLAEGLVVERALGDADGGVALELSDAARGSRRQLDFDAEGRLRRLRVSEAGREWEARYERYQTVAGVPFAHRILLDFPATETHAELSLSDVELNPALPDGLFRLRARPSGG